MFKHLNITCQKGETSDPQTILRSWSENEDKENAKVPVNKQIWMLVMTKTRRMQTFWWTNNFEFVKASGSVVDWLKKQHLSFQNAPNTIVHALMLMVIIRQENP